MANKYKKFVATAATATLVASAIVPVASAAPSDIEGNQFENYILDAIELGLFQDNDQFNPNNTLTRGHVVLILGRYLETAGFEPAADYATNPAFADMNTSDNEEYLRTASIVKEANVFTGSNGEINWKNPIKREAMAAVLDRLAGAVTGKTLVEQASTIEDVTVADLETAQKQFQAQIQALRDLEISTVENFNPKGDVKRGQFAKFVMEALSVVEEIKAGQEPTAPVEPTTPDTGDVVTEASVKEVKAASVKTITVEFDNAVDTAAAEFAIKKGSSSLTSDVAWNEEKTVATLTLAGKITEGEYTVTVSGLTEEALTGKFTATNETVAEVKVLTTETPVVEGTSADTVKVAYQLLNQYGEDVTKSAVLGTDLTVTTTKGEASYDKGVITLTAAEFKADDKATVVVVDKKTGKSATAEVTVVKSAVLDSVKLGEVYNEEKLELSVDNKADQFVLIEGLDQYGEEFDITADNVTIVSSNPEVATFALDTVTIDEETVQAFAINVIKEGKTTLTVVSNATGKSVSKEITVAPGVKSDKVVIADAEGTVSGDKKVLFPIEVTNTKGEAVTKVADVNVTFSVNGAQSNAVVEKDGKLYLEVVTNSVNKGEKGTLVITATTETNETVTKVVTVQPNAVATELVGFDKEVSLDVLAGEKLTIDFEDFIVNDQYGDRMEEDYAITATLIEDTKFANESTGDSVIINTQAATKAETVKFELANTESAIEKKVSVVKSSEFVSYEIVDVPTIFATGDTTFVVDAAYNEELVVKAKTADGKLVTLPATAYKVSGKPAANEEVKFEEKATEAKVTVTVTINDTGAVLTKELTYSNVAPKVADFVFTAASNITEGVDLSKVKVFSEALEIKTSVNAAELAKNVAIVTVDQYGKNTTAAATTITVVPTKVDEVVITENGTANASVALAADVKESTVTLNVTVGDVTKSIEVKLVK